MPGNVSTSRSATVFRRTADVTEAHVRETSFVAYLRERVGEQLCAVVTHDGGEGGDGFTTWFCREDFDLEASDLGSLPAGLRTDHRCTVTRRESTVWLSFDRRDGRLLAVVDARPSRSLDRLLAECRAALGATDRIR